MREYETMDRNASNEPAYRPLGDPPTAHIRTRDTRDAESCYEGSRQVLARMPNLAADPEMDGMARYDRGENRVISSGLSAKVLAGVGIGLFVVAVLGYVLVGGKKTTESQEPTAWQPEAPAPNAGAAPPWASSNSPAPNWQSGTETAASPWNGPAPTPAWNVPSTTGTGADTASPPLSQAQPWQQQNPQSAAAGSPTELTATSTTPAEPVWGQMHEPVPATPAAGSTPAQTSPPSWNSSPQSASWDSQTPSSSSAGTTPAPGWPSTPQPSPAATGFDAPQTAAIAPQSAPTTAAPDLNAWSAPSSGYDAARTAPTYAGAYQQPQAGVNRSMGLADPAGTQGSGSPAPSSQPAAGYTDNRQSFTVGTEPRFDPRSGYGNDSRTASPTSYFQPAPSNPADEYRTADQRQRYGWDANAGTGAGSSFGSGPSGYPSATSQPGSTTGGQSSYSATYPPMAGSAAPSAANGPANSYPSGSYPQGNLPGSSYPSSTLPSNNLPSSSFPTSSYPTNSPSTSSYPSSSYPMNGSSPPNYPSSTYPSGNLPSNSYSPSTGSTGNYPASGYPGSFPAASYPTSSYPAIGGGAPVAATSGPSYAPQYNAGVSAPSPQMGGAQFEGTIEKPTTARAGYDSTRPSLY